jgi:hypothetical protein
MFSAAISRKPRNAQIASSRVSAIAIRIVRPMRTP